MCVCVWVCVGVCVRACVCACVRRWWEIGGGVKSNSEHVYFFLDFFIF